jgi:hypothetical protein
MVEVTKTLIKEGVEGDKRYEIYELTNPTNGLTLTTNLNDAFFWAGTNETTADKPFGASKAIVSGKAQLTLIIGTTTDEFRVKIEGK